MCKEYLTVEYSLGECRVSITERKHTHTQELQQESDPWKVTSWRLFTFNGLLFLKGGI